MINHAITNQVAKLLATENLIVEHCPGIDTASFNVDTRVLSLPIWDNASKDIYDLLISHEVGHALFTPNDKVPDDVNHGILNVVEDVRIEKLMRKKYSGIPKVFFTGYQQFVEEDFFQIKNADINSFNLADRINLYFKIGRFVDVPFHNEREKKLLKLVDEVETFEDAIKVAKFLYEYCQEEVTFASDIKYTVEGKTSGKKVPATGKVNCGNDDQQGDGTGENGEGSDSDENSTVEKVSTTGEQSSGNDDQQGGETGENGEGSDSDENSTVGSSDGNSGKNSKSDQEESGKSKESSSGLMGGKGPPGIVIRTMNSSTEKVAKLIKQHTSAFNMYIPNDYSYKPHIRSNELIYNDLKFLIKDKSSSYAQFKKDSKKEVNHLIKEFEARKSATQYNRSLTAKTGTLDCTKLHSYKYSEDIFNRITITPEGKNHGLVFILDWSGSMGQNILKTVKQMYYLVWFCRRIGIPFDVYAFSSVYSYKFHYTTPAQPKSLVVSNHSLLHFLTSRTSSRMFDEQMEILYDLADQLSGSSRKNNVNFYNNGQISNTYGLGGTPLNDALLVLPSLLLDFQKLNRVEKTHCIILTDGESNCPQCVDECSRSISLYNKSNLYVTNKKTGHIYNCEDISGLTEILLQNIRDIYPELSLIGFRITDSIGVVPSYKNLQKKDKTTVKMQWDKDKYVSIKNCGYNKLFAIHSTMLNKKTKTENLKTIEDVEHFIKHDSQIKKGNKKILTEFSSLIS